MALILAHEGGRVGPLEEDLLAEEATGDASVRMQGPSSDHVGRSLATLSGDSFPVLTAGAPREDLGSVVSILLGANF